MYRSGSSKPKGAAINVSPDPGLRQIVRRGHGGQYQDGSERFCFFTSLTKKSVKTGSPNRPALSLNLTFRGFRKNHVFKVSIASSTCPGFIYQWQKSIIIRTDRQTDGRKHQFGGTRERKKRFAQKTIIIRTDERTNGRTETLVWRHPRT